ncbi:MAG TPA: MFS transporter [Acetobacteraceae bacterium]|jgi:MFS family permease|nr:MFS transporter [Acetobacteraceae bacterium]
MSLYGHTEQPPTSRLRRGARAIRERGTRVRERLTAHNLHAPSLDWLNFLIADVRGGLGPYVVVFLVTEQGWTPTAAGIVGTVGGWVGLAAQVPIGAWLDRTRHKRGAMLWGLLGLSIGAVVIALAPTFWPVLVANAAMQVVSGVFEPAVAALTIGLCMREALTARMGRNAAWSRAGNMAAAVLSGLVAWLFSAGAVFLQVPVIAGLAAIAAMTIPYSKVDLRRARGLEPGDAQSPGPQSGLGLLRSRPLVVFALCSLLYELADAPLLTLVGQKLGKEQQGSGLVLTSALVVASQLGMLAASILIGKRGDAIGHRLLMAIGFALLPVQAVLTVVSGSPSWLVAVQAFGGIGTGLFAGLTPIWLVDATRGSGRYNLAQGVMAAMRALGATTSGLLSELMVEYLGYSEAFLGCGAIGAVAAVLLWFGLPARLSVEQAAPAPA